MVTIKILDDPPMRFWHGTCSQCMWTAYSDASNEESWTRLHESAVKHNLTHKTVATNGGLWKKIKEIFE